MAIQSVHSNLTLDGVTARIIANIKSKGGGDPEKTAEITMGGVPGRALTS
jgi:hypothetical protein